MTTDFTHRELAKLGGTGAPCHVGGGRRRAGARSGGHEGQRHGGAGRYRFRPWLSRYFGDSSSVAMQRADELLRQMTVEEKAMQLSCIMPIAVLRADGPMPGQLDAFLGQGIGHIAGPGMIGHKPPRRSRRASTPWSATLTVTGQTRPFAERTARSSPSRRSPRMSSGAVAPRSSSISWRAPVKV